MQKRTVQYVRVVREKSRLPQDAAQYLRKSLAVIQRMRGYTAVTGDALLFSHAMQYGIKVFGSNLSQAQQCFPEIVNLPMWREISRISSMRNRVEHYSCPRAQKNTHLLKFYKILPDIEKAIQAIISGENTAISVPQQAIKSLTNIHTAELARYNNDGLLCMALEIITDLEILLATPPKKYNANTVGTDAIQNCLESVAEILYAKMRWLTMPNNFFIGMIYPSNNNRNVHCIKNLYGQRCQAIHVHAMFPEAIIKEYIRFLPKVKVEIVRYLTSTHSLEVSPGQYQWGINQEHIRSCQSEQFRLDSAVVARTFERELNVVKFQGVSEKIRSLRVESLLLKEAIAKKNNNISSLSDENKQLVDRIELITKSHAEQCQLLEQTHKDQEDNLDSRVRLLKKEIAALKARANKSEQSTSGLRKSIKSKDAKINKIQQNVNQHKSTHQKVANKLKLSESQKNRFQQSNNDLRNKLKSLTKQLKEMKHVLENKEQQHQSELRKNELQMQQQDDELGIAVHVIGVAEKECKHQEILINRLTQQLKELQSKPNVAITKGRVLQETTVNKAAISQYKNSFFPSKSENSSLKKSKSLSDLPQSNSCERHSEKENNLPKPWPHHIDSVNRMPRSTPFSLEGEGLGMRVQDGHGIHTLVK